MFLRPDCPAANEKVVRVKRWTKPKLLIEYICLFLLFAPWLILLAYEYSVFTVVVRDVLYNDSTGFTLNAKPSTAGAQHW